MEQAVEVERQSSKIDRPLFVSVILLLGFGVVMVYSASAVRAAQEQGSATHFVIRQAIYGVIGIVAMLVGANINYGFYKKIIYPVFGLTIVALILCFTPLGLTINGAARWIAVGPITVQPAEAAKLALILWLSYSLAKKSDKIKSFSVGFLPHLLVPGFLILLCMLQPDFGTSTVIAIITFSLLFIAGAKLGYMLLAVLIVSPIAYSLVAMSPYRLARIKAFLDPIADRFGAGYQLSQSLYGFSAGGVTGSGVGDGLQKFFFLPEAHNDFIASIIGEELGMVGVWMVIAVFGVIVARGIVIAMRAKDEFGTYVAFGISTLIGIQVLANLGVAMGLLPTKGLNLPFVSYGGSALVISLFSVGILLNISKGNHVIAEPAKKTGPSGGNNRRSATDVPEEAGAV